MESNRSEHQLKRHPRARKQTGITLIGFVLLAAVFGTVGLAVLKIVPLYMERMRITRVLEDLQEELATGGNSAQSIKIALDSRMYVENLSRLEPDELEITRTGEGFLVHVNRESRTSFLADLYFVIAIDDQIEISR